MIAELLRIDWISLKRDRVALFLTFVLPIVFFSIFSLVLANTGGGDLEDIDLRVLFVDLDDSEVSRSLIATLAEHEALSVSAAPEGDSEPGGGAPPSSWTRDVAQAAVRAGEADAAIVLPPGMGEIFGSFGAELPRVELIYDAANPMTRYTLSGLLQAAAFESSPEVLMEKGLGALEAFGGTLTPEQKRVMEMAGPYLSGGSGGSGGGLSDGLIDVAAVAARGEEEADEEPSVIAYYAAGIAVMFLLFSVTGAAGGLLEEEERGTLERLLTSNVGMTSLLASRWVFFTAMGVVQVLLMFLWGWAVFDLEIWSANRVLGVLAMSLATAAAASSFGLVLAAACSSRAQLGGLSTIVILVMSALGGSMMPRFLMPDFMKTVSRLTLNGWALDGFLEVFWYDDPAAGLLESLWSLRLELAVLSALALGLFLVARRLARRWEVV